MGTCIRDRRQVTAVTLHVVSEHLASRYKRTGPSPLFSKRLLGVTTVGSTQVDRASRTSPAGRGLAGRCLKIPFVRPKPPCHISIIRESLRSLARTLFHWPLSRLAPTQPDRVFIVGRSIDRSCQSRHVWPTELSVGESTASGWQGHQEPEPETFLSRPAYHQAS